MKKGLYIEIEGETEKELWGNLVDLVCFACTSKNESAEKEFPLMISTEAGMIKIVDKKAEGNG